MVFFFTDSQLTIEVLANMPPAARGFFKKPPLDPKKFFIIFSFYHFSGSAINNYHCFTKTLAGFE
jgi:hypothetical protein